jgi:tetratricopeptide (TPR) repeat protein
MMNLQTLFKNGQHFAERGQYQEAAAAYETFLKHVTDPQLVRSAAFNLAQVRNQLRDYKEALRLADLGLSLAPSDFGRAIAMAARGEALCGLNRPVEGRAAFAQAVQAHPIVGRLNSADSIAELLSMAEDLVTYITYSFGKQLQGNSRAEALTILGKIAAARRLCTSLQAIRGSAQGVPCLRRREASTATLTRTAT